MNRTDLQQLSRERLKDARALWKAHRYDAAYYLAGYSVECALKACIAKRTQRHDFPDLEIARGSYTHNFEKLVQTADTAAGIMGRRFGNILVRKR